MRGCCRGRRASGRVGEDGGGTGEDRGGVARQALTQHFDDVFDLLQLLVARLFQLEDPGPVVPGFLDELVRLLLDVAAEAEGEGFRIVGEDLAGFLQRGRHLVLAAGEADPEDGEEPEEEETDHAAEEEAAPAAAHLALELVEADLQLSHPRPDFLLVPDFAVEFLLPEEAFAVVAL